MNASDRTSDWVEAGNYPTPIDAQMAQAHLEAHGITAAVYDAELANSWVYTNALGGVRLMVAPADLEAAQKILAQDEPVDATAVADEDVISDAAPYCPQCHAKDIEIREDTGKIHRLFGFRRAMTCRACGHEWSS